METEDTKTPLYHSWKVNLVVGLVATDDVSVFYQEGSYKEASSLSKVVTIVIKKETLRQNKAVEAVNLIFFPLSIPRYLEILFLQHASMNEAGGRTELSFILLKEVLTCCLYFSGQFWWLSRIPIPHD